MWCAIFWCIDKNRNVLFQLNRPNTLNLVWLNFWWNNCKFIKFAWLKKQRQCVRLKTSLWNPSQSTGAWSFVHLAFHDLYAEWLDFWFTEAMCCKNLNVKCLRSFRHYKSEKQLFYPEITFNILESHSFKRRFSSLKLVYRPCNYHFNTIYVVHTRFF